MTPFERRDLKYIVGAVVVVVLVLILYTVVLR